MKNLIVASLMTLSSVSAFASGYHCTNEAKDLQLYVWKDAKGSLVNALIERADGFSHYLACWNALAAEKPTVGTCQAVLLVDSYDAELVREGDHTVARLTQWIGQVGGEKRDAGTLICRE